MPSRSKVDRFYGGILASQVLFLAYASDNLWLKDAFKVDRFYGGILASQVLFLAYAFDNLWLKDAFKVDLFLGVACVL